MKVKLQYACCSASQGHCAVCKGVREFESLLTKKIIIIICNHCCYIHENLFPLTNATGAHNSSCPFFLSFLHECYKKYAKQTFPHLLHASFSAFQLKDTCYMLALVGGASQQKKSSSACLFSFHFGIIPSSSEENDTSLLNLSLSIVILYHPEYFLLQVRKMIPHCYMKSPYFCKPQLLRRSVINYQRVITTDSLLRI